MLGPWPVGPVSVPLYPAPHPCPTPGKEEVFFILQATVTEFLPCAGDQGRKEEESAMTFFQKLCLALKHLWVE